MNALPPDYVMRPGPDGWELWTFPAKGVPVPEFNPSRKSLARTRNLLLAIPSRDLLALPLWVSPEGDATELCELELSSRHLLRRDSAVCAIPVASAGGRTLALALAAGDESPAAEFFEFAKSFDAPARLWSPGSADAAIWRESGLLCYAFYREGACVFFAATGHHSPGPAFCGLLERSALRLSAEAVTTRHPQSVVLIGPFSPEESDALHKGLRIEVRHIPETPPPTIPDPPAHAAPPSARAAEAKRARRRKFLAMASVAALAYLACAAAFAVRLVLMERELSRIRNEQADIAPAAESARRDLDAWRLFRHAIDPGLFAIDQIAAVAREIPGDQVRLTQFALESGRLLLSGEAADVSQAYQFLEKIKSSSALQEYDWTARQPQLAGKTKVRFEMEGVRPDAQPQQE